MASQARFNNGDAQKRYMAGTKARNIPRKACPERRRRDAKHVLSAIEWGAKEERTSGLPNRRYHKLRGLRKVWRISQKAVVSASRRLAARKERSHEI